MGAEAGPILAAGLPFRTETEMSRQAGSLFWCRLSAKAIDPRRPQDGTIWIMEDVTQERAQREALARAHEELEQRVIERTAELSAANAKLQEEVFERLQAEQRIWHVAHHDSLTGLPNRALLHDRLHQAIALAHRHRRVGQGDHPGDRHSGGDHVGCTGRQRRPFRGDEHPVVHRSQLCREQCR